MGPFQMFLILTATWCGGVLTKEPDLNTETIALEQYGVVLKPGKLMSNADVTHVQQGFRITIPKEKTYNKANYNRVCYQFVKAGLPELNMACNKVRTMMGWMHFTSQTLKRQFREVINETLMALQMTGEKTATASSHSQPERGKRLVKLPTQINDLGWPAFPISTTWNNGLTSDIKYNRELIDVIQKTSDGTLDDLATLTNRTEEAIERADLLTMDLLQNIRRLNVGQNTTNQQVRRLSYEIDGQGVALNMLPIALEEKLGEILYLQSLIRQAYVFRKGIQHLIRGQLTMDLVPREYVSSAVNEVNRYLQMSYSRFHVAFTSPSFYYENSHPLFKYNETYLRGMSASKGVFNRRQWAREGPGTR